jgi:hypothetical protein
MSRVGADHHRLVGGVVLVAKHGEPVVETAAGLADREAPEPIALEF